MSDGAQVDSFPNSSLKQPGGAAGGPAAEEDPDLDPEPDQEAGPGPELGEAQRWTGDKPRTKLLIVQFC